MTSPDPQTITQLLDDIRAGEEAAPQVLLGLVYDELSALARALFSNERDGHTLQPTALIHEAWMKLGAHLDGLEDRHHFFVVASRAMRQVLVDHARRNRRQKRGDARRRVTLDEGLEEAASTAIDMVDLDDSLSKLAALNARHAQVVELRILGGLTIAETAKAIGVSHATVENDWFTARAWLRTELRKA